MVKKRRKLSKDYEKELINSGKEIELILAKINDIDEDDIRVEYTVAFAPLKNYHKSLKNEYKEIGYTEQSTDNFNKYSFNLKKFKEEYEI